MSLRRRKAQYVTCTPINLKNECFKEQNDKFEKYNCQMKWDDTAYYDIKYAKSATIQRLKDLILKNREEKHIQIE